MTLPPENPSRTPHREPRDLRWGEALRWRWAQFRLRWSASGNQSRWLGSWLEGSVFPEVRHTGAERLRLRVNEDSLCVLGLSARDLQEPCIHQPDLVACLNHCGIKEMDLDPRLESNQVVDLLAFIASLGPRATCAQDSGSLVSALRTRGVTLACMTIRVTDATLVIRYTYCTTCFSRAVHWFERRHKHFRDHRALFGAAPWYALLPSLLSLAVFLAFSGAQSFWMRTLGAVLEAGLVFALVYVFFLVVGSVEYDKEERSYRVEQARARLERYAERVGRDLRRARQVQQKLLPTLESLPRKDKLRWAFQFHPETEVGGDYFDAAELPDGKVAILFADVSGHGMAAAFITALLKSAFQDWVDHGKGIEAFVADANGQLVRLTPDDNFAVLIAAEYDPARRRLRYCNCGHFPEPILLPADGREPKPLDQAASMLLGVIDTPDVQQAELPVSPGEKLLFATDGLVEARNAEGQMFGRERLLAVLGEKANLPVDALADALADHVDAFADPAMQADDRTVLAMEFL